MTVRCRYRRRLKVKADPFICQLSSFCLKAFKGTATEKLKTLLINLEFWKSAEYSKLIPDGKELHGQNKAIQLNIQIQ